MSDKMLDQISNHPKGLDSNSTIYALGYNLYLGEKRVTNFIVDQVIALCAPDNQRSLEGIQLRVCLSGTVSHTAVLDVRKKSLIKQLLDQVPVCRLLSMAAGNYLDEHFLMLAETDAKPCIYFRENGLHRLWNGSLVMVCGDEVLGDCGSASYFLHPNVSSTHLVWDPKIPPELAIERQLRTMERHSQTAQLVFGFTLLSALRSELMQQGFSTFPVLSVLGTQNYGKTVLVTKQCLLYDDKVRKKPASKLEPISTETGLIYEISAHRDQVVLVDDLAKGSHKSVEQERMKMMANLLRYAANDSERHSVANSMHSTLIECNAGVAFTGEISFTSPSDLSRIIQVVLSHPLRDGSADDRNVAATAFRAWISWFLPQAEEQFKLLAQLCEQSPQVEQARLQTTHTMMRWVLISFYQFALERGVINEEYFRSAARAVSSILYTTLNKQVELIANATQGTIKGNLSWYILQGYRKNSFRIVDRKKIKSDKDCVFENGALCIRMETLKKYIRKETPYSNESLQSIGALLEEEKAIPPIGKHKEKRRAGKKIKGYRYLEIYLDALKKAAKSY